LAKRVSSEELVEIKNYITKREIPYLLCTSRTLPPRGVFESLVRSDEQFPALFADACMLSHRAMGWLDMLIDAVLSSQDTKAHIILAYYIASSKPENWENILEKLYDKIPHKMVDGKKIFTVSTADYYVPLWRAVHNARDIIALRERYKRAKKNSLNHFFARNEDNAQLSRYKSWILYRYHPKLILPLLKQYGRYTRLAAYHQIQLKQVLLGALRYGAIFEGLIPSFDQVNSFVRFIAFESKEPVKRINGLSLLEELVNEDDLPKLRKLAYDKTNIKWRESKTRMHYAPLVAIRAVHCIKAVNSAESRLILEEISQDEKVHPRVAKQAEEMLQKEPTIRALPSQDNDDEPVFSRPEERGEDFSLLKTSELVQVLGTSEDMIEKRKAAKVLGDRSIAGTLKLSDGQRQEINKVVQEYLGQAGAPTAQERVEAKQQIERLWHVAIPTLLKYVDGKEPAQAELAIKSLILMRNETIVRALIKKAREAKDEYSKAMAIFALEKMKKQRRTLISGRQCLNEDDSAEMYNRLVAPAIAELQKNK